MKIILKILQKWKYEQLTNLVTQIIKPNVLPTASFTISGLIPEAFKKFHISVIHSSWMALKSA